MSDQEEDKISWNGDEFTERELEAYGGKYLKMALAVATVSLSLFELLQGEFWRAYGFSALGLFLYLLFKGAFFLALSDLDEESDTDAE